MNRKLIIAAIGFVIAAGLGSHFYIEWQMAKFDASLPTPPTEEQLGSDETVEDVIEETGGETTGGHWHGDEWHAEPHVDEAPLVQPIMEPAAGVTAETEAAVKLPPLPPTELELEHRAIKADFNALLEQRDTLSPAEFQKGLNDIADRWQAHQDKFDKLVKARAAAYREMRAERKQAAVGDR